MSEEQAVQRQFLVQRIYTKDISFEAPNSPQMFQVQEKWNPEINVGLGSEVTRIGDENLELVLKVSVEAKHEDKTVFLVEVQQAGVFLIQGFSDEETEALMGVAAPNVLFPYAREAVSDLVTRGSFPQFVLQPVNFEAVYAQQRQAKAAAQAEESGTAH
ncbi:MAG: protein-export chaperone SecB [Gammaproteobacteria bacterium]|nr:protein-export chaperone SecB [Gammaproteobacteria bacterium]